ncbi:MAG: endonuclease III [Candidatus Aenigmatarchaeota archaeon]|nr:MAG: endonuclease III [Candidatus Aenigmarchaeota archaeon]
MEIDFIVREMRRHTGGRAVVWNEDPFRVLISTVLSQRTKDENTRRASERLFSVYSTPQEIANAPNENLEELIKSSGFYKVKAERIKTISRQLVDEFGGSVPRNRADILKLKGVGPKTAGCVQVYGFDDDALPVDTHVHRISNRLGLVRTKTPEETEPALMRAVPKKEWKEINHLMVRYGQSVCLPRSPKCSICGLKKICRYYKGTVTS